MLISIMRELFFIIAGIVCQMYDKRERILITSNKESGLIFLVMYSNS